MPVRLWVFRLGAAAIQKVIPEEGRLSGPMVFLNHGPDHIVHQVGGMGIGAHLHAEIAVRAGFPPVTIAGVLI